MCNATYTKAVSVSPNDSNDLPSSVLGLSVNVAGNVTMQLTGAPGVDVVLAAQVGIIYPIQVKRVKLTGTAATGILGWI